MNIAPKNQVQTCNLCKKSLDSENFQDHLIEHEMVNGTVSCVICTSIFTSIVGLKDHIREHNLSAHDLKEVCTKCNSRFLYRSELAHHMQDHGNLENRVNNVKQESEPGSIKEIKEEEEDDDYIEIEKVAEV